MNKNKITELSKKLDFLQNFNNELASISLITSGIEMDFLSNNQTELFLRIKRRCFNAFHEELNPEIDNTTIELGKAVRARGKR